jgi:hypothetical protein
MHFNPHFLLLVYSIVNQPHCHVLLNFLKFETCPKVVFGDSNCAKKLCYKGFEFQSFVTFVVLFGFE